MRVFIGYLEQIVGKSLFVCFIYMFIFICCISCHFWRFMLLNAALWLAVTLTFKGSEPKLAHWPKWNCITLPSWFCSLLTSNRGVSISHFLDSFTNFAWNTKNLVKSSLCEYIETNIPVARLTLHVFVWYFHQIVGKNLFECFIYVFVSIYCILGHFQRFMVLNATLWLTVTHTFKGNGPKLADWSKWICITVGSCFCSLLTWNWEVSTGRSLCSFTNFAQITQNFLLSSYIEDIETNLPFEKAYLACIYMISRKDCWQNLVWMLHLCVCLDLLQFVLLLTIYAVEQNVVVCCHAYIYG